MPEYIVVPVSESDKVRDALTRAAAEARGQPAPRPGEPAYVEPQSSADGKLVAFGPRDELLDGVLGKSGIPSKYEVLDPSWFTPPPGSLALGAVQPLSPTSHAPVAAPLAAPPPAAATATKSSASASASSPPLTSGKKP
jgi:hypothetical protein